MTPEGLAAVGERLEEVAAEVFAPLVRVDQRGTGVTCLRGLLLDGRRKSMRPMAARLGVDHQGWQQFVCSSTWPVEPVRGRLARWAVAVIGPGAWVVGDTDFSKDGTASPGVARQYRGTLGKVGNCQVGVSVHAVTGAASGPLDWRLFVPGRWEDTCAPDAPAAAAIRVRRARAAIPGGVRHRRKWRLVLDLLEELAGWGLAPPVVVADAGDGSNADFRAGVAGHAWTYVVQVEKDPSAHAGAAVPELVPCSGAAPDPSRATASARSASGPTP
jgi:SRSO17 transposase